MPGVAFDGSVWVTGGQTVGLVFGSVLFTCAGAVAMLNATKRLEERQLSEQFTRPQPRSRPVQRVAFERDAEPGAARRPAPAPQPLEPLERAEMEQSSSNGASR